MELKDKEAEYLEWVAANPSGFVANIDRAHSMRQYPMAHFASCSALNNGKNFTTGDYYKVVASSLGELETWAASKGKQLTHCSACNPFESTGYWWVNHKQTSRQELNGGYIWSPMTKKDGSRNQAYINMTLVRRGDVVVSYADTFIKAIGVASGSYFVASKPEEYGDAGESWNSVGWRVPVEWTAVEKPIRPKAFIEQIRPLLAEKYAPLQSATGDGNQGVYLSSISPQLGGLVLELVGLQALTPGSDVPEIEAELAADLAVQEILAADLPETEKAQLVMSRRGQGIFRQRVLQLSPRCPLTAVADPRFLVASHIKPWRVCSNAERLDGRNGLMLAPHVDRLFDQGWISFEDSGYLLISDAAKPVLEAWNLNVVMPVGPFASEICVYLKYHREEVFKR